MDFFLSQDASMPMHSGAKLDGKAMRRPSGGWTNVHVVGMFARRCDGRLVWDDDTDSHWFYDTRGYWYPIPRDDMRCHIADAMERWGNERSTSATYDDVLKQLKRKLPQLDMDDEWVSFEDVMWSPIRDETAPKDKSRFATLHIPVNMYSLKDAECPMFDRFLMDALIDDDGNHVPELAKLLQEYAGYVIYPQMKQVPALFLYGSGSNGKSVFLSILSSLAGSERVSTSSLSDLFGSGFGLSRLVGMRLNCSSETGNCRETATESFKKVVFGDMVTTRNKFGPEFHFRNKAKQVFSVNVPVAFSETTEAMSRRLVIVPFSRHFDRKDSSTVDDLDKRIIACEFPGVVRWAMEGLRRLKENRFVLTSCRQTELTATDFLEESSSVLEFLGESFVGDHDCLLNPNSVYDDYKAWCSAVTRKAVSRKRFGNEFAAKFGKPVKRHDDGTTVNLYRCRKRVKKETECQF